MRTAPGLITVLFTGVMYQAMAADPPPPAAAAPAEQQSATTPATQQTATPATPESSSIKPPITVVGTKPDLTPQDKELLSRGYKLEMRHGEKYFCMTEQVLGSRRQIKNCDTAESIEARRLDSQEAVRVIQNDRATVNK
jgi:hypothetical protein